MLKTECKVVHINKMKKRNILSKDPKVRFNMTIVGFIYNYLLEVGSVRLVDLVKEVRKIVKRLRNEHGNAYKSYGVKAKLTTIFNNFGTVFHCEDEVCSIDSSQAVAFKKWYIEKIQMAMENRSSRKKRPVDQTYSNSEINKIVVKLSTLKKDLSSNKYYKPLLEAITIKRALCCDSLEEIERKLGEEQLIGVIEVAALHENHVKKRAFSHFEKNSRSDQLFYANKDSLNRTDRIIERLRSINPFEA